MPREEMKICSDEMKPGDLLVDEYGMFFIIAVRLGISKVGAHSWTEFIYINEDGQVDEDAVYPNTSYTLISRAGQ
jgi:hypothetical protein